MKITIELEIDYGDSAHIMAYSVSPENGDYVDMSVEDGILKARLVAENPMSALHTVDDLIQCLQVAEGSVRSSGRSI